MFQKVLHQHLNPRFSPQPERSMYRMFIKNPRPLDEAGKGGYWTINYDVAMELPSSSSSASNRKTSSTSSSHSRSSSTSSSVAASLFSPSSTFPSSPSSSSSLLSQYSSNRLNYTEIHKMRGFNSSSNMDAIQRSTSPSFAAATNFISATSAGSTSTTGFPNSYTSIYNNSTQLVQPSNEFNRTRSYSSDMLDMSVLNRSSSSSSLNGSTSSTASNFNAPVPVSTFPSHDPLSFSNSSPSSPTLFAHTYSNNLLQQQQQQKSCASSETNQITYTTPHPPSGSESNANNNKVPS